MRNLEMQRNVTFNACTLEEIQDSVDCRLALQKSSLRGTAVLWNGDLAMGNIPARSTLPHRQQGNHKTREE